jgi:hypothetical protein
VNFTTEQLETIAQLTIARTPPDKIAAAVNISEDMFAAWCTRLALGRAWREPVTIPPKPERRLPERLRYRAERYFEAVSDAPALLDDAAIQEAVLRYSC